MSKRPPAEKPEPLKKPFPGLDQMKQPQPLHPNVAKANEAMQERLARPIDPSAEVKAMVEKANRSGTVSIAKLMKGKK